MEKQRAFILILLILVSIALIREKKENEKLRIFIAAITKTPCVSAQ